MSGKRRGPAARVLLLATLALAAAALPAQQAPLEGEALVAALRAGGYNLYFRHAATDWSQQDRLEQAGDWTSCDAERMRQLSAKGRETAGRVGAAMRALGIPVGEVLASPYCRTVQTAQALSLGPVRTTTAVMNLRAAEYFGGREAIAGTARERLAVPPPPGTNTIVVAHGNVLNLAAEVYLDEAEAAVFAPQRDGSLRLVARVSPSEWENLAQRHAPR